MIDKYSKIGKIDKNKPCKLHPHTVDSNDIDLTWNIWFPEVNA